MAMTPEAAGEAIQSNMSVVGSDGRPFGFTDAVQGRYLKLFVGDPVAGGEYQYLPVSTIVAVEGGQVRLGMPAAQASEACVTEDELQQRLSLDPEAAAEFGAAANQEPDNKPHGSRAHAHGGPKGRSGNGQEPDRTEADPAD